MMGRCYTPDYFSSTLLAYPFAEPTRPRRKQPRKSKNGITADGDSAASSSNVIGSTNSLSSPSADKVKAGFRGSIRERRTKNILFYRNGDKFFKGKKVCITPHRYLTFNELLTDLTRSVSLPYGVRKIYTSEGEVIDTIDDLEDGKAYVCASFERFKQLQYGVSALPDWSTNTRKQSSLEDKHPIGRLSLGYSYPTTGKYASSYSKAVPPGGRSVPGSFAFAYGSNSGGRGEGATRVIGRGSDAQAFKPRLVKFIKYGLRPQMTISILLNKRTVFSFEHLLNEITDAFDLAQHKNQRIRKLYTTKGREIRGVSDFFRETDSMFIAAVNRQPLPKVELQDILEEIVSPRLPEDPPKPRRKFKDKDSKSDSGVEVDYRPGDSPIKSASADLPPLKNSPRKEKIEEDVDKSSKEPKIKVKAWATHDEREEDEKRIKAEEKRRREETALRKKEEAERKVKEEEEKKKQEELKKQEEEKERKKKAEEFQADLARKEAELKAKEEELRRKEEESRRKEEERKREEEKRKEEERKKKKGRKKKRK